MSKKILVTGGMGYIGSHTVVELLRHGYEPVILDNLSRADPVILKQIEQICGIQPSFEQLDLCDLPKLTEVFGRHHDIKGVIHFAALKAVGESVHAPLSYYRNNLTGLINLLQCMQQLPAGMLVFSSSCTVYGQPDKLPVTENAEVKPAASPYANTKKISEEIILDATKAAHLHAISLRYFNPIGAHESGLLGELPIGVPDNLVPYITQTAIGKREHLTVFGNDYSTPDGTCIRDYIHISDLAVAHVVALERLLEYQQECKYEVFNLGTGKGHSVLEMIRAFEKSSGEKLPYKISSRRPGDVEKVWADASLAQQKLGWKASLGIDEMMASAWKWEQNLAAGILTS